jgi:NADPH:quinone reductase-like Zn-dependent oxidoreductase
LIKNPLYLLGSRFANLNINQNLFQAAGGAGQIAVQLAKLAGNHVIGTCSSDDKVAMLKVRR